MWQFRVSCEMSCKEVVMLKRSHVCSLICVLMLGLNVSVVPAGQSTVTTNQSLQINTNQSRWTVMAYLDGDNELEGYAIAKFMSMSQVGSSSNVTLLAQLDRIPEFNSSYGNWNDTKRFLITQGMTPIPTNAVQDLGEQDMGNLTTLTSFIRWGVENYTADHYFLILFDHGQGAVGTVGTGAVGVSGQLAAPPEGVDYANAPPRGLMYDHGDFLTTPELGRALDAARVKIDVLYIDGCYMAGLEVAYQIAEYVDVMVGYEGQGHGDLKDQVYDKFLASLVSNSSMTSTDIGVQVVTDFASIWSYGSYLVTCSAVDLTKLNSTGLVTATDNFATRLKALYTQNLTQIQTARNETESYGDQLNPYMQYSNSYADLYDFADRIYNSVLDSNLQLAASEVKSSLTATVISSRQYNYPHAHGLSVYFPENMSEWNWHRAYYLNCSFAIDTDWDEWLDSYYVSGITITSNPQGSGYVTVDDVAVTTPYTHAWVFGSTHRIAAVSSVSCGTGCQYFFTGWSDGGAQSHTITVPSRPTTYTATFQKEVTPIFNSAVRGLGGGIFYGQDVMGTWTGWTALPGFTAGSPGAVQCGGQLYFMVEGTGNTAGNGIFFGSVGTGSGLFSGWTQVPGATPSGPGLAADSSGNLYAAVTGTSGGIFLNTYSGGVWQGWIQLPGATSDGPAVAVTASTIYLAVRGMNSNGIYFGWITRSTMTFQGWFPVAGATPGKPGLAAVSDTEVYMTVQGMSNGVYLNMWNGASWAGWTTPAGGATPSGPSVLVSNGKVYLMVRGMDNSIYWSSGTWGGSWSTWTQIPAGTVSSPTLA
jgi:hypothetical protein